MFHQIINFVGIVAEVICFILLNSRRKLIPESVFSTQGDIKTKRNLLEQTAFVTANRRGFTVNDEA